MAYEIGIWQRRYVYRSNNITALAQIKVLKE